jgi:hypothetical protein
VSKILTKTYFGFYVSLGPSRSQFGHGWESVVNSLVVSNQFPAAGFDQLLLDSGTFCLRKREDHGKQKLRHG